jgi:hypothetical protein
VQLTDVTQRPQHGADIAFHGRGPQPKAPWVRNCSATALPVSKSYRSTLVS